MKKWERINKKKLHTKNKQTNNGQAVTEILQLYCLLLLFLILNIIEEKYERI